MNWHKLTGQLREYFTFTRKERNGIYVLLCLLVILQGALIATHYYDPFRDNSDLKIIQAAADSFIIEKENTTPDIVKEDNLPAVIVPEAFDPNTADELQLQRIGLKPKTVNAILNFRKKGGRFYKKEDLKKIYNLTDSDYRSLEPYIVLAENNTKREFHPDFEKPAVKTTVVEINSASKEDLMKLPGIGEKRAEQIIKYRNRLGGFLFPEQLKEVYSVTDSVYDLISTRIKIDRNAVTGININTVSDTLYHPYLKKNLLKLIVNYRLQHGSYKSVSELKKLPLMTDSVYQKVEAYLFVE